MIGCESSSAPRQQIRCCLTLDTKFDGGLRKELTNNLPGLKDTEM